jgi:DNA-binding MarR family transcriptional regulator
VARTGPPTVLFEVFWAHQKRKRLIESALAGTDLPPEDYPLYVMIGAEGPWTPTGLAARLVMPLSTVIFRVKRLEQRGHAERVPNPDDGRSFLIRLTPKGKRVARETLRHLLALETGVKRNFSDATLDSFLAVLAAVEEAANDRAASPK